MRAFTGVHTEPFQAKKVTIGGQSVASRTQGRSGPFQAMLFRPLQFDSPRRPKLYQMSVTVFHTSIADFRPLIVPTQVNKLCVLELPRPCRQWGQGTRSTGSNKGFRSLAPKDNHMFLFLPAFESNPCVRTYSTGLPTNVTWVHQL